MVSQCRFVCAHQNTDAYLAAPLNKERPYCCRDSEISTRSLTPAAERLEVRMTANAPAAKALGAGDNREAHRARGSKQRSSERQQDSESRSHFRAASKPDSNGIRAVIKMWTMRPVRLGKALSLVFSFAKSAGTAGKR